jgi:hypothetical protein
LPPKNADLIQRQAIGQHPPEKVRLSLEWFQPEVAG